MNTRKTEKTTNSRLFNKGILPVAVATAMFGAGAASAFSITTVATIDNQTGGNSTTNYLVHDNVTLSTNSSMSVYYGTLNGVQTNGNTAGAGMVVVGGNLTVHGNVGGSVGLGNFTVSDGYTLTLASNVSVFNSDNMTLNASSTLNLGNSTTGYNRGATDELVFSSNISMGSGSTINVGNGTTFSGQIYGTSDGAGTLNVLGNFTSGGNIGSISASTLAQINISGGNTFTLSHDAKANNMDINGTVTADGSIVANVTMGASGTLNLNTTTTAGDSAAATLEGTIDGYDAQQGTLNINGTFTTQGVIGGTYGLAAINLDVDNNATSVQGNTVTFAHSVNATTITLGTSTSGSNTTLQLSETSDGSNLIITGDIAGGGNYTAGGDIASGVLDINSDTDVTGTIGTSGAYLAEVQVAESMVLTAKKSIFAGNITLEQATAGTGTNATLALNGTSGISYNVKGGINGGSTEGDGLIDINSGNWTFDSEIGTTNLISGMRVENGAWANLSNDVSANETITINGTMNITGSMSLTAIDSSGFGRGLNIGSGVSELTTNATLQISNGAVLTLGRNNSGSFEGDGATFNNATIRLINAGTSSYSSNSTAAINIGAYNQTVELNQVSIDMIGNSNNTYSDGQVVNIIGRGNKIYANGTLTVTGSVNVIDGSAMLSFSENSATFNARLDNSTSALQVTVNYVSAGTLGLTGNTQATYDGAKTAIGLDNAVFSALSSMGTNALVDAAIATLHPATGGAAAASASISGSSMSTASTRMAYTRQTGLGKGMNAGGATLDESMWVQIFGANVDQDNVNSVSGYDADGQGIAMGIDGMSEDGMTRIGIAGSFANTDVTGKDSTTKTTTDIDTTQVMVYANKDYADGMYVEGVASYAFNDNTGTRRILVGAVDRTASSAYDSGVFAVNVEAGWPKENNGVTITPTLGLAYSHLSSDAYTETGAGNMNLKVTPGDVSTFESKVGVKITGKSVDADGGIGRPEVRIGVTHNFGDDTADSTATFTAGGTSFKTTGVETDSTKVDLGLGYTYTTPEGDTDISVNIDGRSSSSYLQYGGGLTVKWKF